MAERIVTTEELLGALRAAAASGDRDVFAPVLRDGRVFIEPLAEGAEGTKPHLGPGVSTRSPKDFFFPPSEEMLRYARTERGMELESVTKAGDRPVLLFGVRPCAGRAVALLDRLFDSEDYRDPSYVARREATTIVGLACSEPLSTCFCASAGGDPFGTDGLDARVADLGEGRYLVRLLTEKGEAALGSAGGEAGDADASRADELAKAARDGMGEAVPVAAVTERLGADLVGSFESDLWERFHEKCLGCAACAFTCPTCHCFNIADESTLSGGRRVRTWDCCMMPLFTKHVSGHNPRESTRERMRQRIMHKFLYYVKNFSDAACVGCGRCVRACPVNNDLRDVLRTIAAAELGAPAEA
ncbi:MAG: 4Fe-4S dicluster domain-containing protein [Planctomycetota bacterium]|jgi:ferredoxin